MTVSRNVPPSDGVDPVVRIVGVSNPATLRELAALIERRRPARPRARLSDEKLAELEDMVCSGKTPTVGWWRRALVVDERMATAYTDVARMRAEWDRDR